MRWWPGQRAGFVPDKEEIWKFSPFIDLSLYRSIKQRFKHPALDWQVLFSLICVILEIARMTVAAGYPMASYLYYMIPRISGSES